MGERASLEELAAQSVRGDRPALEQLAAALVDDLYNLAYRMLGSHAEAQDAAQDVLIQVITNLGTFRGESSLRTWAWRIATRHMLRIKKGNVEQARSFEAVEALCRAGDANLPMPALAAAEIEVLVEEIRLTCTEAMVLSLDRDQRMAWILAEMFDVNGEEGAALLGIEPAAFRKRVSRANERLGEFMNANCSLVNGANPCACKRQVPVALAVGVVHMDDLQHAGRARKKPIRSLPVVPDRNLLKRAANVLCDHPHYAAPERLANAIRDLIDSGRLQLQ